MTSRSRVGVAYLPFVGALTPFQQSTVFVSNLLNELISKFQELMAEKEDVAGDDDEWKQKNKKGLVRSHGTLVICPASLVGQWEGECKKRVRSGEMNVLIYHGNNRGQSARR